MAIILIRIERTHVRLSNKKISLKNFISSDFCNNSISGGLMRMCLSQKNLSNFVQQKVVLLSTMIDASTDKGSKMCQIAHMRLVGDA